MTTPSIKFLLHTSPLAPRTNFSMPPKLPSAPGHLRPLFRRFLLSVHPDLFAASPEISKQNEASLQIVLPFFNSLFAATASNPNSSDFKNPNAAPVVIFHVKVSAKIDKGFDTAGEEKRNSDASSMQTAAVRLTLHGHSHDAKVSSVTKL